MGLKARAKKFKMRLAPNGSDRTRGFSPHNLLSEEVGLTRSLRSSHPSGGPAARNHRPKSLFLDFLVREFRGHFES